MQPTETIWTTLAGDHPGIIPLKFGQIQWAVSEKMLGKKFTHTARRTADDDGQRPVTIAHREHFV